MFHLHCCHFPYFIYSKLVSKEINSIHWSFRISTFHSLISIYVRQHFYGVKYVALLFRRFSTIIIFILSFWDIVLSIRHSTRLLSFICWPYFMFSLLFVAGNPHDIFTCMQVLSVHSNTTIIYQFIIGWQRQKLNLLWFNICLFTQFFINHCWRELYAKINYFATCFFSGKYIFFDIFLK